MTNKYASEDLYTSFNIRAPQERSDLYHKYGLTDNATQSMPAYNCSNNDSWGQETGTILFDSVTGKYFRANRFVDSSNTSRWFTLDQLSQTASTRLSPSNTQVEVYSSSCVLLRTFSYIDPTDNVTKYLVAGSNLHWRTASEMNSAGLFFEEVYAPLYLRSTGTTYVTLESVGTISGSFEFSYDGLNFSSYTLGTEKQVNDGERIFFRGTRSTVQNSSNYLHFTITGTGTVAAYGNTNSLAYKSNYISTTFTQQNYSYYKLFFNCDKLTRAPLLPYTRLSECCYESMFEGCSSLATPPQLPATTLADSCYLAMFSGCTSLVRSPDLPAIDPAFHCYNMMFSGCSSLNEIHCKLHYDSYYDDYLTEGWVYNVAPTGRFYCDTLGEWPVNDDSFYMGVPIGWIICIEQPVCFENTNSGTSTVALKNIIESTGTALTTDYEYAKGSNYENATWTPYTIGQQITLQQNEKIYFRGSRSTQTYTSYMQFELTGKLNASGNINSLLSKSNFADIVSLSSYGSYTFYKMFVNCQYLYSCPDLPAVTLTSSCYAYMFDGCTNIEEIPVLPSTSVASYAYQYMFRNCTSLEYIDYHALPATTVGNYGYYSTFRGCTNLKEPPELPAMQLGADCYGYMFYNCGNLWWAPDLPATTLSYACYICMFYGCTNIDEAPILPGKTLTSYCYSGMFKSCTNVDTIICKAENIADGATNCTTQWLLGAAASGEFYYYNEDIWTKYTADGIPDGWSDYLAKPLCFENTDSNEAIIKLNQIGSSISPVYSISRDDNTWESYTIGTNIQLNSTLGNKVYFKGSKGTGTSSNYIKFVTSTSTSTAIKASGNANSMLSDSLYAYSKISDLTSYGNYCLYCLFKDCHITTAPVLPAMTLTQYCYCGLFSGCTKLTVGPILPAKVLANSCYLNMYSGCASLNEIHCDATSIPNNDCVNWYSIAMLPSSGKLYCADLNIWPTDIANATPIGWDVYVEQPLCFENRDDRNYGSIALNNVVSSNGTSLTKSYEYAVAPISASYRKLKWQTYSFTGDSGQSITFEPNTAVYFRGSRSTQNADSYLQFYLNLPDVYSLGNTNSLINPDFKDITTVDGDHHTFFRLFNNCLALCTPPSLPSTWIYPQAYYEMFRGCSDLTYAAKLPSENVPYACYYGMYRECTSITAMPKLSADTLYGYSYAYMFNGCTSLTTVKDISATTLEAYCQYSMFDGCTSLTQSPALQAAALDKDWCYGHMFNGCTSLNEVTCFAESITGTNATTNWLYNVASTGKFVCKDSSIWTLNSASGIPSGWTATVPDTTPLKIRLYNTSNIDSTVTLTANNSFTKYSLQSSTDGITWSNYTVNTPITLSGSSQIIYFRGDRTSLHSNPASYYLKLTIDSHGVCELSGNVASLLSSSPAVYSNIDLQNYGSYAFINLFKDCTKLYSISHLILPSKLATGCFYGMFEGCTSMYTGYNSKLLPSTQLKSYCYYGMFKGCTSMYYAPCLPATSIAPNCYNSMFYGCTSLQYIQCDLNTVSSVQNFTYTPVSLSNWLYNVDSTGEFICKHPIIYTKDSISGIPSGWTVLCKYGYDILMGPGFHSPQTTYWHMLFNDNIYDGNVQGRVFMAEPRYFSARLLELGTYGDWHWADDGSEILNDVRLPYDNSVISTANDEFKVKLSTSSNLPVLGAESDTMAFDLNITGNNFLHAIGEFGSETDFYDEAMPFNDTMYELEYSGNNTKVVWSALPLIDSLYENTMVNISEEYVGHFSADMDGDVITISPSEVNTNAVIYESPGGEAIPPQSGSPSQYTYTITGLFESNGKRIPVSRYNNTLTVAEVNGDIVLRTTGTRSYTLEVYTVTFTRALAS